MDTKKLVTLLMAGVLGMSALSACSTESVKTPVAGDSVSTKQKNAKKTPASVDKIAFAIDSPDRKTIGHVYHQRGIADTSDWCKIPEGIKKMEVLGILKGTSDDEMKAIMPKGSDSGEFSGIMPQTLSREILDTEKAMPEKEIKVGSTPLRVMAASVFANDDIPIQEGVERHWKLAADQQKGILLASGELGDTKDDGRNIYEEPKVGQSDKFGAVHAFMPWIHGKEVTLAHPTKGKDGKYKTETIKFDESWLLTRSSLIGNTFARIKPKNDAVQTYEFTFRSYMTFIKDKRIIALPITGSAKLENGQFIVRYDNYAEEAPGVRGLILDPPYTLEKMSAKVEKKATYGDDIEVPEWGTKEYEKLYINNGLQPYCPGESKQLAE